MRHGPCVFAPLFVLALGSGCADVDVDVDGCDDAAALLGAGTAGGFFAIDFAAVDTFDSEGNPGGEGPPPPPALSLDVSCAACIGPSPPIFLAGVEPEGEAARFDVVDVSVVVDDVEGDAEISAVVVESRRAGERIWAAQVEGTDGSRSAPRCARERFHGA